MVKESWGKKRTCPKCDTRFYDLNKDPLICPNCEHSFSLESIMKLFKNLLRDSIIKTWHKHPPEMKILKQKI